jgi:hypothetical protein
MPEVTGSSNSDSVSNSSDKKETNPPKKPRNKRPIQPIGTSPLWVLIVGVFFLALAVIFFMGLIVASVLGFVVPDSSRFLICIVLALTAGIGSGFLGGSAAASGQISLPKLLQTPVKFGVTGGIAVFLITWVT